MMIAPPWTQAPLPVRRLPKFSRQMVFPELNPAWKQTAWSFSGWFARMVCSANCLDWAHWNSRSLYAEDVGGTKLRPGAQVSLRDGYGARQWLGGKRVFDCGGCVNARHAPQFCRSACNHIRIGSRLLYASGQVVRANAAIRSQPFYHRQSGWTDGRQQSFTSFARRTNACC